MNGIMDLNGLGTNIASLISEYYMSQEFEFVGGKEISDRFKCYIKGWKPPYRT